MKALQLEGIKRCTLLTLAARQRHAHRFVQLLLTTQLKPGFKFECRLLLFREKTDKVRASEVQAAANSHMTSLTTPTGAVGFDSALSPASSS